MVDKQKTWVKVSIIIVAVIFGLVGGIIVMEAHQYYEKVPESSYYQYGGYTVVENLSPNILYNQSAIYNPGTIYNSITKNVNISTHYSLQLNNMSGRDVTVINTVTLVSSSPAWSKVLSVNVTNLKNIENDTLVIPVYLNMTQDLQMATNIDNQLQDGSSVPVVQFNLSVQVSGIPQFNTSMSMELHGAYESLSYSPAQPVSSTQFKNELVVPNNLIGLNKYFGYAFLSVTGGLVVYSAFLYAPRTTDPITKIRKEYGDQIVEISVPAGEDAIKIRKLEDLLRMSEIFEVPVFIYNPDKILYLNHLERQYYYEII